MQTAGETFERARILVADGFGENPNEPYTRQPGACGEEGDFTHVTPKFLLSSDNEFPLKGDLT